MKSSLDLALIGNSSFAALVDRSARIVWGCMPRFDSDPVFCSLLGNSDGAPPHGFWDVELEGLVASEQRYLPNTAVLVTQLRDGAGNAVEVVDFAPRFRHYGRMYRPIQLVRQIRPLSGTPRIRVRLRPAQDYGAAQPTTTRGSNHLRFVMPDLTLRLTTDAPISYVSDEVPFVLETPLSFILGPDESLTQSVAGIAREFLENTENYWRDWVRGLSIPFEWQEAVIRAAITLKLSAYEETGAIIAAVTTSIPEAAGTERNWDYRFCWLRDSYYVVQALNRLGATRTMESYLFYITNLVAGWDGGDLQPVFGIAQEARLDERTVEHLPGYRGMGPVRVGNHAYTQIQNDGYGSVILATTQAFFDQRIAHPGTDSLFERLERIGERGVALWDQPDAGLWELRNSKAVHTYSSVLCWAGCDRLARIARHLGKVDRARHWAAQAERIREGIIAQAWDEELGSFTQSFGGSDPDASLLLLPSLGFISAEDPRFVGTLAFVEKELRRGNHLFRYAKDEFGVPDNSFNICTFWYIDALAQVGRSEEARALFEEMLMCRNAAGLLSEDLDPETKELWGNFPQTYSMVGLINSAMRLSRSWEDAF